MNIKVQKDISLNFLLHSILVTLDLVPEIVVCTLSTLLLHLQLKVWTPMCHVCKLKKTCQKCRSISLEMKCRNIWMILVSRMSTMNNWINFWEIFVALSNMKKAILKQLSKVGLYNDLHRVQFVAAKSIFDFVEMF